MLKAEHMTACLPVKILALSKTHLQKYILRGAGLQLKAGSAARHQEQEQLLQNHSQDLMGEVTPQGKGAREKKKQELWTLLT